mgnify:CR=1 FL=1
MLCLENQTTDKNFTITTEEEKQSWVGAINEYFKRGFADRPRNYAGIISEAIDTLKLGG